MKKVPITVGVIGHRDADITEDHKTALTTIFTQLSIDYPNSPIYLFSQLALGADTIVAHLFMDAKKPDKDNKTKEKDFHLIVPLPYQKELYKKTQFNTKEELNVFEKLFKKSSKHFVLDELPKKIKETVEITPFNEHKILDKYYRRGGEFIADSSIILITIWDGKDNEKEGGSSNIYHYKNHGLYGNYISDQLFDFSGNTIDLRCNRLNSKSEKITFEDGYFDRNFLNELLQDGSIKKSLGKIEELNDPTSKIKIPEINESKKSIFPFKETIKHNSELLNLFGKVDALANKQQLKNDKTLIGLFILGLILLGSYESFKYYDFNTTFFFSTLALLALAFGVFKFSINWENHNKYIENRVLAESLRIQFFWSLSDIKSSTSKYILRLHKNEYNWIKHVLQAIHGATYPLISIEKKETNIIVINWIISQRNYFEKKIKESKKREKDYEFISSMTLIIGVFLLIIIYVIYRVQPENPWIKLLSIIDTMIFGTFALIKAYYKKKAFEEIQDQYSLMLYIFKKSQESIEYIEKNENTNTDSSIKKVIYLTGKEALIEHGNWYMIFKEKQPELDDLL